MAKLNTPDLDLSDALFMEHEAGREAGRREARSSQAAKTRAKTTEHKRTLEREESRRKTSSQRTRRETAKRQGQLAREQERTRRAPTVEAQRTVRELQREHARSATQRQRSADARRRSRRSGGGGGGGVPTIGSSGVQMSTQTGTNIVLGCIVGAALAVSFRHIKASNGQPSVMQLQDGRQIRVPSNLRSLGGVMLAGTVCLVLVQLNTPLGVVFGVLLLLDSGFGTAVGNFSDSFFGLGKANTQVVPKSSGTGGASNFPSTPPRGGGISLPGGNPGVQRGGQGPIEVPYGSPSG